MFKTFGLYTDLYELTMAQGYFLNDRENEHATFDYFFRRNSFKGNYMVFAGLSTFLEQLKLFRFTNEQKLFLNKKGFHDHFLDYLSNFNFEGTIEAPREGELVFPNEPIIRVEGPLAQVQLLETLLLNTINFQTLLASKAKRMHSVAGRDKKLIDFGLRRAQGYGGYHASRAAYIGGFDATSNVQAGMDFNLPVSGTMAHSWVQSYENELDAFRAYAKAYPDNCILLVDTYDTLKSGIPNAIKVAKEMEKNDRRLKGIRLDSGELGKLSLKARHMLDEAGLQYVAVAVSNQLDEYKIREFEYNKYPIDVYGVGTRLITAKEDPALDGVYKLAQINEKPVLKLSETIKKTTLPGRKKIVRLIDVEGSITGDLILLEKESLPSHQDIFYTSDGRKYNVEFDTAVPLRQTVWAKSKPLRERDNLKEHKVYCKNRFRHLPAEIQPITPTDSPYPVLHSKALHELQQQLVENHNKTSMTI